MGKVGFRFLVVFFSWFGALIVLINFVGWSGAYVNLAAGSEVNWTNSYFGFESIFNMLMTLDSSINAIEYLSIKNFPKHLADLLDTLAFGLPGMFDKIGTNNYDVVGIAKFIFNILGTQPLYLLADVCICTAHVIYYALNFIGVLVMAFGGRFNLPFDNPLTPNDVINQVRISVPMLI